MPQATARIIYNTFLMRLDMSRLFLLVFADANGGVIRFVFVTIFCLSHNFLSPSFCLLSPPCLGAARPAKTLFMILFSELNEII